MFALLLMCIAIIVLAIPSTNPNALQYRSWGALLMAVIALILIIVGHNGSVRIGSVPTIDSTGLVANAVARLGSDR